MATNSILPPASQAVEKAVEEQLTQHPSVRRAERELPIIASRKRKLMEEVDALVARENNIREEVCRIKETLKPWLARFAETLHCDDARELGVGRDVLKEFAEQDLGIVASAMAALDEAIHATAVTERRRLLHLMKVGQQLWSVVVENEELLRFDGILRASIDSIFTRLNSGAIKCWRNISKEEKDVMSTLFDRIDSIPLCFKEYMFALSEN